jgi:hypothetical protein
MSTIVTCYSPRIATTPGKLRPPDLYGGKPRWNRLKQPFLQKKMRKPQNPRRSTACTHFCYYSMAINNFVSSNNSKLWDSWILPSESISGYPKTHHNPMSLGQYIPHFSTAKMPLFQFFQLLCHLLCQALDGRWTLAVFKVEASEGSVHNVTYLGFSKPWSPRWTSLTIYGTRQ